MSSSLNIEVVLAMLLGDQEVMHGPEDERRTLHNCANMGYADGVLISAIPWTDGTPELTSIYLVGLLELTVEQRFKEVSREF